MSVTPPEAAGAARPGPCVPQPPPEPRLDRAGRVRIPWTVLAAHAGLQALALVLATTLAPGPERLLEGGGGHALPSLGAVLFFGLFALAQAALLLAVTAPFESFARGHRSARAVDAIRAIALTLPACASCASLAMFVSTGLQANRLDLWFAVKNVRQLLGEAPGSELLTLAAFLAFVLAVGTSLFVLLRRTRRSSSPRPRLVAAGWVACPLVLSLYAGSDPLASDMRTRVPQLHWMTRAGWLGSARWKIGVREPGASGLGLTGERIRRYEAPAALDAFRPFHVMVVMLESVPWTATGIGGGRPGITPHLDALAEEAVVFSRAYTTSVHSDYAQMAILSSLHPRKFDHHDYYTELDYPRTLLWDPLHAAGYATGMFSCQNERWGNMIRFLNTPGLEVLRHSLNWPDERRRGRGTESKVYEDTSIAKWQAWREEAGERPFFAYLNFQSTHFPYKIPPEAARPYQPVETRRYVSFMRYPREAIPVVRNRFDNALHYADASLGRVIASLKEQGVWDETVLVVVSDHGEAFYEHEHPTHGTSLFDEQTRSLLMMRVPGQPARRVDEPISLLDVAPTVLRQLRLPACGNFQGRDDILEEDYDATGRPLFFTIQGLTEEDGVLLDDHKLSIHWDTGRRKLFDLATDPGEHEDLSATRPERVRELEQVLRDFLERQGHYYAQRGWEQGRFVPRLP